MLIALALRLLDEIDAALPQTAAATMGRLSAEALRQIIEDSPGAADHAASKKRPRRKRTAPELAIDQALQGRKGPGKEPDDLPEPVEVEPASHADPPASGLVRRLTLRRRVGWGRQGHLHRQETQPL